MNQHRRVYSRSRKIQTILPRLRPLARAVTAAQSPVATPRAARMMNPRLLISPPRVLIVIAIASPQ